MLERQELHCHDCNRYVQFDLDLELNGNHVLACPNCGHEHCRVVRNGVITDQRWDQRNNNSGFTTYMINSMTATTTSASTFNTYLGSCGTYDQWLNTTCTGSTGYY